MNELQDFMYQLITGGFETITSGLAHAMWLLVRHPDQLALLRADPSLMKGFVEESLRIESPVQGQPRITTRDTEVGGVAIPAGTIVIVRFGAANHDEAEFADPEQLRHPPGQRRQPPRLRQRDALLHRRAPGPPGAPDRLHDPAGAPRTTSSWRGPLPEPAHHPSLFYLPLRELPLRFAS